MILIGNWPLRLLMRLSANCLIMTTWQNYCLPSNLYQHQLSYRLLFFFFKTVAKCLMAIVFHDLYFTSPNTNPYVDSSAIHISCQQICCMHIGSANFLLNKHRALVGASRHWHLKRCNSTYLSYFSWLLDGSLVPITHSANVTLEVGRLRHFPKCIFCIFAKLSLIRILSFASLFWRLPLEQTKSMPSPAFSLPAWACPKPASMPPVAAACHARTVAWGEAPLTGVIRVGDRYGGSNTVTHNPGHLFFWNQSRYNDLLATIDRRIIWLSGWPLVE